MEAGVQVLKLIMGPTRHLSQKKLQTIQTELSLIKQCDEWLTR
jgi:hypothetical protein